MKRWRRGKDVVLAVNQFARAADESLDPDYDGYEEEPADNPLAYPRYTPPAPPWLGQFVQENGQLVYPPNTSVQGSDVNPPYGAAISSPHIQPQFPQSNQTTYQYSQSSHYQPTSHWQGAYPQQQQQYGPSQPTPSTSTYSRPSFESTRTSAQHSYYNDYPQSIQTSPPQNTWSPPSQPRDSSETNNTPQYQFASPLAPPERALTYPPPITPSDLPNSPRPLSQRTWTAPETQGLMQCVQHPGQYVDDTNRCPYCYRS